MITKKDLGLQRKMVKLLEHSDNWNEYGKATIKELQEVLGDDAIAIQHIGSTSIIGLIAKPIIDIVVGLRCLEIIDPYILELAAKGYNYVPARSDQDHILFACGDYEKNTRTAYIHIVVYESKQWKDYLAFRDILNNDEELRKQYTWLKIHLQKKYPNDIEAYTEGKKAFIQQVLNQKLKES